MNLEMEGDELHPLPRVPIGRVVKERLTVLISLLLLQSLSQFILKWFENLISANIVIPLFLTMLVGAGGNAGNQAAVHAITGLVTDEFRLHHLGRVLRREIVIGAVCASGLFFIGFMRVQVFYVNDDASSQPDSPSALATCLAISLSLFCIVVTSVTLGCMLPFGLRRTGVGPEHAAPIIQVVMDILGVLISCFVCSLFLPSRPYASQQQVQSAAPQGVVKPTG